MGSDFDPSELGNRVELMTKLGYWSPERPADRGRVNRMMGEELPPEYDEELTQRSNARLENDRLIDGADVFVSLGDDHDVHIEEHLRATVQPRYRDAISGNKALKAAFEFHILAHEFEKVRRQRQVEKIQAAGSGPENEPSLVSGPPPGVDPAALLAAGGMIPPAGGGAGLGPFGES